MMTLYFVVVVVVKFICFGNSLEISVLAPCPKERLRVPSKSIVHGMLHQQMQRSVHVSRDAVHWWCRLSHF